jgi:N-acyl amino acid synthase of PEP-CTERM/exosortase system
MDKQSRWAGLSKQFRYEHVRTRDQLECALRIRYEVYCREFGFERPEDCPGQMESDEYDAISHHCLIRHIGSSHVAGCVRVIPADAGRHGPLSALPIERFCASSLQDETLHPARLPRNEVCEISRLAVPALFRRRPDERRTPVGNSDARFLAPADRRTLPLIGVSMFVAAAAMVRLAGRRHMFAMMEPKLARLLGQCGVSFQQVGDVMDYHGLRAPFHLDLWDAEREADDSLRPLYALILTQLGGERGYWTTYQRQTHPHALAS